MSEENLRAGRGQAIAQLEGEIRRIDETTYAVKSQSGKGEYHVTLGEFGWICRCPDATFREVKCKHIFGVEFSLTLRQRIVSDRVIKPVNPQNCPLCQSPSIVRHGIRHNNYGDIQQFLCKGCGHAFVVNLGFERMRAPPQMITSAMQLYFSGESLRNTQKFLKLQGLEVSHVAILSGFESMLH